MLTMDHLISWQWISKTNCKSMNVLVPPLPPRFLPIRPPGAAHEEALETESDSKLTLVKVIISEGQRTGLTQRCQNT